MKLEGQLRHQASPCASHRRPLRAAFFGYSWRPDARPDSYMAENIDGIRRLGVDVDLYLGNYFAGRSGTKGFRPDMSAARIARYIRKREYDFAVSFNNSMMMPTVIDSLDCRPVSVIVDSEHHLFDHADRGGFSAFDLDFIIAPIYTSLRSTIEARYPKALDRYQFLPPATETQQSGEKSSMAPMPFNISWVASLPGDADLDHLARHLSQCSVDAAIALPCLERIRTTGYLGELRDDSRVTGLAERLDWDIDLLERHLQNIVTSDERIKAVNVLSDRGLRLFGNDRWSALLSHNLGVARSFAIGEHVSHHGELMNIYNSSRVSINLPQAQAKTGIQYRTLDIMASSSLLVTKFVPGSDLVKIFGRDCPVPQFKDLDQLRRLADYYLKNERRRRALVRRCNALVSKGFSFVERAADYLRLSNTASAVALPHDDVCQSPESDIPLGVLNRIDHRSFINWTGYR